MSASYKIREVAARSARLAGAARRAFTSTARTADAHRSTLVDSSAKSETESASGEIQQAPNRTSVWANSQIPRNQAMVGPRFEQTDFSAQPAPYSAMALIHEQPVQWTHDKIVVCDGGVNSASAGHPRIFINTDKPKICVCNYCGTPYANEHHRKHIEAQPKTAYPLQTLTWPQTGP
ncbi:Lactobacillus shifted protein [Ceratocystis lukuohia]|uniref:Lactobacillus shifted protein n=1 Tax=Ceratocystis lukuohia TaxID=2019550 RepID=A0ABR4MDM3_9PEZI